MKIKSQKGINLVTLSIAIVVIVIITNIVIYNATANLRIKNLRNMQSDISNLRDKVSSYYAQYGRIPADTTIEYTNVFAIRSAGMISDAVDLRAFYVIDLSALENLTLNYGKDYEKIRNGEATTQEEINQLTDLYIINGTSHNIFYVQGIDIDGEMYYTDYTKDEVDTAGVSLQYYHDGVKIPEGFTVSDKEGETSVDTGLVVYGPDGSEFVWVPVDIDDMAQCSTAGGKCDLEPQKDGTLKCITHNSTDIVGKLYATSAGENFGTVNTTYNPNSGFREPATVTGNSSGTGTSYDGNGTYYKLAGYSSRAGMLEGLKNEYKEMAQSVAKYGGFYVGRYETSLTTSTSSVAGTSGNAQSKAGVRPTAANNSSSTATYRWYGLYSKSKTYQATSVQSSMIWGSQYDAIMNWALKGNDASKVESTGNGNHSGSVTTTGNSTYSNDNINNIRDLEGNLREWTLEAYSTTSRILRGGYYSSSSSGKKSPSYRTNSTANNTTSYYGSRLTLYIK